MQVQIFENNGVNVVSSRVIADNLGKQHSDVTKKIKDILTVGEYSEREYKTSKGNKYKEFLLSKDSFVLLVMNYEGFNDFKRAYIQAFNEMEKKLSEPKQLDTLSLLKLAVSELEQKDKLLKEQAPKVEFYNAVADVKTAISMDEVAKVLNIKGMGRNNLFEFLRNKKILMFNNKPYQRYVKYFNCVEQVYKKPNGQKDVRIKTLVYQNGVDFIRKLIEDK